MIMLTSVHDYIHIYILFADHVPTGNRDADIENRFHVLQIPAANQPHTVFEIENQGIYLNFSANILHFIIFHYTQ